VIQDTNLSKMYDMTLFFFYKIISCSFYFDILGFWSLPCHRTFIPANFLRQSSITHITSLLRWNSPWPATCSSLLPTCSLSLLTSPHLLPAGSLSVHGQYNQKTFWHMVF